jgi:signal transduction histidine kinase
MIVYPSRRALTPFFVFIAILVGLYLVTLAIFWILARPTTLDLQIMTVVLAAAIAGVGVIGFIAFRLGWIHRMTRINDVILATYVLASLSALFIVWISARLLFIETYDVFVVTILMLFGGGVVVAFGYLQSSILAEKVAALSAAAEALALGRYHVRVEIEENDELIRLAGILNAMAAKLERADQRERQLSRLRRDLNAWIAYDLRVPMLSALTVVDSIAEGLVTDPDMFKRYLHIARRDLNALSNLIDDLNDMTQADITGIRLERAPTRLCDLIESTIEELTSVAAQKEVTLTSRCEANIPPVSIDARQINRVLNNLVGDAIQRVPRGGSVKLNAYPARSGALIEITDTYTGMRPEDVAAAIKLFFGEEDVRSQAEETARLRLALADVIVRAHGSQIRPQRLGDRGMRLVFALTQDGAATNPLTRRM